MSVTLRKRKNGDGTTSLRLDIYFNGQRHFETLKNLKLEKPSTLLARENNKELMRQAEAIKVARAAELEANNYSLVSDASKKTIVVKWLQSYVDGYTKKDKRNMEGVVNRFTEYLRREKKEGLTFQNLSVVIIEGFVHELNDTCKGEGASSYFARFKKAIKQAYRKRLMRDDVLGLVEVKPRGKAEKKDILTLSEIRAIAATSTESKDVKRAALFSAMTGLRWIDIKALKWNNINLTERRLKLKQIKTGEAVDVPLNEAAIRILGTMGLTNEEIFNLPSANGANKTLKALVKRAGITKKITWHNLRHSFGTNLIYNEVDVLTASKLLGHSSLRHTQRYVDTAEEMKRTATDKISFDL